MTTNSDDTMPSGIFSSPRDLTEAELAQIIAHWRDSATLRHSSTIFPAPGPAIYIPHLSDTGNDGHPEVIHIARWQAIKYWIRCRLLRMRYTEISLDVSPDA